jgi:ribosomal protein S18 acetylase RimI-like enzyme
MRTAALKASTSDLRIRPGDADDLAALLDLEQRVFATDRMSRRSLRHFLTSPTACSVVAERDGATAGYALILFRPNSMIARLYSIAVAPDCMGRGIGPALLAAAEEAARAHSCGYLRLEVHEKNRRAIELYRKCGYHEFGRHCQYYRDKGHALRFQKALSLHTSAAILVRKAMRAMTARLGPSGTRRVPCRPNSV